jgi:hypothetical protein
MMIINTHIYLIIIIIIKTHQTGTNSIYIYICILHDCYYFSILLFLNNKMEIIYYFHFILKTLLCLLFNFHSQHTTYLKKR